ncbi:sensor histidine kinase [Kitasatospora sp. NPDC056273]|uniref:sensor histidine kinase n=1 Tax=Kitasatospora sp. NPDC056273 TaxID=3345769 RepID=UPI0035E2DF32
MRRRRHPEQPISGGPPASDRLPGADRPKGGDAVPWTRDDALVAVAAAALDLVGYSLGSVSGDGGPGGGGATALGVVLIVLPALPLLFRRSHPVSALAAVLALGAAENLSAPPSTHFGFALSVALYSVARVRTAPVTALMSGATAVVTLLNQSHGRLPTGANVLSAVLAVAVVVGTAVVVNRWQQQVAAHRRLLADRAVAEERRRIARELHDIVAHHITTMQLMAGGARANLGGDTEVVRDALVTLESSGRMALREMRQLLDVLRADEEPEAVPSPPQPGADDLDRIVDESRLAGLPTEFEVSGRPRPLPPTVGLTVFRIVQESLTNTRKHAGPASAHVRLTYRPDRVTVEVRDDGAGTGTGPAGAAGGTTAGAAARTGHGLIGMRERVTLHGGTLETGGLATGGYRVAASLPLAPGEAEEALR